ncbi:hypothetical protein FRB91_006454 [Serendipita sp. 411]|nr:hypothetical protein FRB91_006454 [Serendipita sp. 411]
MRTRDTVHTKTSTTDERNQTAYSEDEYGQSLGPGFCRVSPTWSGKTESLPMGTLKSINADKCPRLLLPIV